MLQLLIASHAPLDPLFWTACIICINFLLLSTNAYDAYVDADMDAQLPSDPVDRPADVWALRWLLQRPMSSPS